MGRHFLLAAVLGAIATASSVLAISKVTRGGRYLYTDDGNRFYIKGVAYQEQGESTDHHLYSLAFFEFACFL